MKIRHVFGALTVTAITFGMTSSVSVVRAQDHHDPYLSSSSPKSVEQSSPQAVEPVVVEQSSPHAIQQSSPQAIEPAVVEQTSPKAVKHHEQPDPYILKTSPKAQKVKQAKACKTTETKQAKGPVTIVGCFYRDVDSDGDHAHYMLADMTMGPATPVRDQNCTPSGGGQLIRIKDADDVGLNQVASNRWVELYGKLGSGKDADDPRKFEVKSFREVPLAQRPRIAIIIPPAPPAPQAAVETPPALEQAVTESPKPMATTGETPYERKLPKTASELPLIALLGLFALSGGLVLGLVDRRRAFRRG
ncbi:MAG TPA: LPXTG cell wall anchor domain-containing protein [Vicinamibacterales bacterium]